MNTRSSSSAGSRTAFPLPWVRSTAAAREKQVRTARELQQTWHRLALNFLNSQKTTSPVAVGVTSTVRGEGKTTNSLGLASALARETQTKVLLLECDLASQSLAPQLGLEPKPGLVEYIKGDSSIEDALRPTDLDNLEIFLRGGEHDPDAEWEPWIDPALGDLRRAFPTFLAALKQQYSYIVIDLPALLISPNSKDMVQATDGAFISLRADTTLMENVAPAIQEVDEGKLLGVLLVGAFAYLPDWLSQLVSE